MTRMYLHEGDFNASKYLQWETSTLGKRQRIYMGENSTHVNIYIKRLQRSENEKNIYMGKTSTHV